MCGALGPADQPVPGDLLMAEVAVRRRLGDSDGAMKVTDALLSQENGLSREEQRILFTQRAAVWLDLDEFRPYQVALSKARAAANKSWTMGASHQCRLVYQRLQKLEADAANEQTSSNAVGRSSPDQDRASSMGPRRKRLRRTSDNVRYR